LKSLSAVFLTISLDFPISWAQPYISPRSEISPKILSDFCIEICLFYNLFLDVFSDRSRFSPSFSSSMWVKTIDFSISCNNRADDKKYLDHFLYSIPETIFIVTDQIYSMRQDILVTAQTRLSKGVICIKTLSNSWEF